jgi:hypothetical protein
MLSCNYQNTIKKCSRFRSVKFQSMLFVDLHFKLFYEFQFCYIQLGPLEIFFFLLHHDSNKPIVIAIQVIFNEHPANISWNRHCTCIILLLLLFMIMITRKLGLEYVDIYDLSDPFSNESETRN